MTNRTEVQIVSPRPRFAPFLLSIFEGRLRGGLHLFAATLVLAWSQISDAANQYTPPSSSPAELYPFGEFVYFSADDGKYGRELWRANTRGVCENVKDITPGPEGTTLDRFHAFKDHLYFRVRNVDHNWDLWRTDGTEEGTIRFLDAATMNSGPGIWQMLDHTQSKLFFLAGVEGSTADLWVTDGTFAGTQKLNRGADGRDFQLGMADCGILRDSLVFSANCDGHELWMSDGTQEGTRMIRKMGWYSRLFMPLDENRVVFTGDDGESGSEVWVTGGTPETTIRLKDIYPGPESSEPSHHCRWVSDGHPYPRILFAATEPKSGREIWITDGTPEGTELFLDVFPGAGNSQPYNFVAAGDAVYFLATGDQCGKEWWLYNEISGTLRVVQDIFPGPTSSDPYAVSSDHHSNIVFSANAPNLGEEWWVIEGGMTAHLLGDIYAGSESSEPYHTVMLEGRGITSAYDPVHGRELWIQDVDHAQLLADIYTDNSVNPSSSPSLLTPAGDYLFFTANNIESGNELWRTDGSRDGTILVKDIYPGPASSNPEHLTAVGNLLYFSAEDARNGVELWKSDGREAGTAMVMDIAPNGSGRPRNLIALKDVLIFSATRPEEGEELWCVRPGRLPGLVKNIYLGPESSKPDHFVVWKDHVYFQADDGIHGRELWRTDGTTDGTYMLRDIVEAPYEGVTLREPREINGTLYFAANIGGFGEELWRMDESGPTIRLVRDIATVDALDVSVSSPQQKLDPAGSGPHSEEAREP